MTWEMYDGLERACQDADGDDEVRVVVLRGAGEKAFVAGTDIAQFRTSRGGRTASPARAVSRRPWDRCCGCPSPPSPQCRDSASAPASRWRQHATCGWRRVGRASVRRSPARSATACRRAPWRCSCSTSVRAGSATWCCVHGCSAARSCGRGLPQRGVRRGRAASGHGLRRADSARARAADDVGDQDHAAPAAARRRGPAVRRRSRRAGLRQRGLPRRRGGFTSKSSPVWSGR